MAGHIFRPAVTILIRMKPSPQLRIHCPSRAPLLRGFLWVGLKEQRRELRLISIGHL
jgi:hypothetical protein